MTDLNWDVVRVAGLFGAMGGMAASIGQHRQNPVNIFGKPFSLGILGDAFVGAAAGIAVQLVADNNVASVHVVGLALLAGVAGSKFLFDMSGAVLGKLMAEQRRLGAKVDTIDQVLELVREGERLLTDGRPKEAEALFRHALEIDKMHPLARLDLAKSLRHQADIDRGKRKSQLMKEAIRLLDECIQSSSRYDRAYYNRACYKAVSGMPPDTTLADLKQAISLFAGNRSIARRDPDFISLRENADFLILVGTDEDGA